MRGYLEQIIYCGLTPIDSRVTAVEVVARLHNSGHTPKGVENYVSGVTLDYDFGSIVIDRDGVVHAVKIIEESLTAEAAVYMILAALTAKAMSNG